MKKTFLALGLLSLVSFTAKASTLPVFSANGFICGKEGITVTCKGPVPGGRDTVTSTGHDMVYLTVNTHQEGQPTRYTYFSDTGCLIGYTFDSNGQPNAAVASHRSGAKKTFALNGGSYDPIIEFCAAEQKAPSGSASASEAQPEADSAPKQAPSSPAAPAKKLTSTKKPIAGGVQ
jgi:hypothetical protein